MFPAIYTVLQLKIIHTDGPICGPIVNIIGSVASLASYTLRRERKGLVTLQLPSCCRGTQLSNIAVR